MSRNYAYGDSDNDADNSELRSQADDQSYDDNDQSILQRSKKSFNQPQNDEDAQRRSSNYRKKSFTGRNSIEIKPSLDRRTSQLSGRIDDSLENIQEEDDEDDDADDTIHSTPDSQKPKRKKKGFRIKGKTKAKRKSKAMRKSRVSGMSADSDDEGVPVREYYEKSLTPVLLQGLKELGRKRPSNPIRFLGNFLLENDPEK